MIAAVNGHAIGIGLTIVADTLAHDIAANTAPLAVAYSKRLLWDSWDLTRGQIERRETDAHHRLMGARDATGGVLAYLDRRPPSWQGRVSRDLD